MDVRSGPSPPKIGNFSKEATKKAVLNVTLQHPLTLYSATLGALGGLTALLLEPSMLVFFAAVGSISVGIGSWIFNYFFRSNVFANRYIQNLCRELNKQKEEAKKSIKSDLIKYKSLDGAEHFIKQGVEQFGRIQESFEKLREILFAKFNAGELTLARYLGTSEQVYLSVLDNLKEITDLLKSVSAIDVGYLLSRLGELNKLEKLMEADEEEIKTLNKRKKIREEQLQRINTLLTRNEEAMTQINETIAVIAETKTMKGQAMMDMETARQELENLAKRAKEYSLQ